MKRSLNLMGLAALVAWPAITSAQQPDAKPARVIATAVVQDGEKVKGPAVNSATRVQIENGKLIVTDSSGNTQEIDLKGAQNIQFSTSETSENNNGDVTTETRSRAIIVGPDGEKTEIVFDGPANVGKLRIIDRPLKAMLLQDGNLSGEVGALGIQAHGIADSAGLLALDADKLESVLLGQVGKHYIGVQCEPVHETLRTHLGLDEGTGVVVKEVTPDSPAEKAGILRHDIVLFAGETPVNDIEGLSAAVNQAGQDGQPLALTLLRGGKETRVEVTPAQRETDALHILGDTDRMDDLMGELQKLDVHRLGPGLLLGAEDGQQDQALTEMRKAAEQMQSQMEAQMKMMQEQLQQSKDQMQRSDEMLKRQMEELKNLQEKMPKGNLKMNSNSSSDSQTDSQTDSQSDSQTDSDSQSSSQRRSSGG